MRERRLPISLEGLWNNPNEIFTVRYKDINPKYQAILAKRIKETAKQASLKRETGPSVETIQDALKEINPVIFSEMQREVSWYRGHQVFGISPAVYIAGYRYNMLCQAVYLLTCRKKALNAEQIIRIARLTFENWEVVTAYVHNRLGLADDEEERVTPIENLGIEDIARARERAEATRSERNTANEPITPDENYDRPQETANTLGIDELVEGMNQILSPRLRSPNRRIEIRPNGTRHVFDIEAMPNPPIREWQQRYMPGPVIHDEVEETEDEEDEDIFGEIEEDNEEEISEEASNTINRQITNSQRERRDREYRNIQRQARERNIEQNMYYFPRDPSEARIPPITGFDIGSSSSA